MSPCEGREERGRRPLWGAVKKDPAEEPTPITPRKNSNPRKPRPRKLPIIGSKRPSRPVKALGEKEFTSQKRIEKRLGFE
jgi:hypothetical protein